MSNIELSRELSKIGTELSVLCIRLGLTDDGLGIDGLESGLSGSEAGIEARNCLDDLVRLNSRLNTVTIRLACIANGLNDPGLPSRQSLDLLTSRIKAEAEANDKNPDPPAENELRL